jgi:hypothetical protein
VNGNAGYYVGIYDQTTGQRWGYCSGGRECTLTGIVPTGGGSHLFVAAVGPTPGSWSADGAWVVSTPVPVSDWAVALTAADGTGSGAGTVTLTATSTYPVNGGGGYYLGIYDATTGERFGYCSSGTVCTLTDVRVNGAGTHTLVAAVGPTPGTWSATGNWATSAAVNHVVDG